MMKLSFKSLWPMHAAKADAFGGVGFSLRLHLDGEGALCEGRHTLFSLWLRLSGSRSQHDACQSLERRASQCVDHSA